MKQIELTKGLFALVDDEDYEVLSSVSWYAHPIGNGFYAARHPKSGMIYMHRQLLGFPDSDVDHRDRNGLNNQRSNLRLATDSENNFNRVKCKRNGTAISRFKGVNFAERSAEDKRWRACIGLNGKLKVIGHFQTEEEAARAYDSFAKSLAGDFAVLNFP